MARRRAEFEGPFLDYIAELSVEDASAVLAAAIAAHPEWRHVDASVRYPSRTPKTTRWQWRYPSTATGRPLMWDSTPTPWGAFRARSLTTPLWASYAEVPHGVILRTPVPAAVATRFLAYLDDGPFTGTMVVRDELERWFAPGALPAPVSNRAYRSAADAEAALARHIDGL